MKRPVFIAALTLIAACSIDDPSAQPAQTTEPPPPPAKDKIDLSAPAVHVPIKPYNTEPARPEPPSPPVQTCAKGALKQGGLLLCTGVPGDIIKLNGTPMAKLDKDGHASIGLRQHSPLEITLSSSAAGREWRETLTLEKREDTVRKLKLNCDQIDARTPEQKDHAGRSWVKKQAAWKTFHDGAGFWTGVSRPASGPTSSPFGPTRKYYGVSDVTGKPCESTKVHRGYDIATPVGTPLLAPASGVVTLADPDLYYEGGTIFLDHGHGLKSIFLHLSEVSVEAGQTVKAGEELGKTGNTGRSSGPHLHWGVKWRNTLNEERGGDFYIDPAFLLTFNETP